MPLLQANHGRLRHRALRSPAGNGSCCAKPLEAAEVAHAPTCRICWEGEGAASPLLTNTCQCSGSLGHVHVHCLLQWRRLAHNPSVCATCKAAIQLPRSAMASVRLPPWWAELAGAEAERLRAQPGLTLLRWWNGAVMAAGLVRAAAYGFRAWNAAPGLAAGLRDVPVQQGRWPLLAGMLAVAAYQRLWMPWLRIPQRALCLHAACYAAGAALDCGALGLVSQLAGCGGAAAAAAGWVCKAAACLGVALQISAVQHLHPLRQFVQGYATGISSACVATGSLLLHALRFALLPLGLAGRGTTGRMLEGAARTLPFLLHSVCHAVAFAGRL